MCKNSTFKVFNLKSACKDCPFRRNSRVVLNGPRIQGIMDDLSNDMSFTCHKTIASGHSEFDEIREEIEVELQFMAAEKYSHAEIHQRRIELMEEPHYKEALEEYEKNRGSEMYCAGAVILAKKTGKLFNNAALRYAVGSGLLDLNQYIDEDGVFDSVEEAVNYHSGG